MTSCVVSYSLPVPKRSAPVLPVEAPTTLGPALFLKRVYLFLHLLGDLWNKGKNSCE